MARFNEQCKYDIPPHPAYAIEAMGSRWSFLMNYLASGREFCELYPFWKLPLYYAFGALYIPLKVFLLNPPLITRFQSTLRFEVDADFPGENPKDRLTFAKSWYSMDPRKPPFLGKVGNRFTHLASRSLWMEQFTFGLPPLLSIPAQTASGIFDQNAGVWRLVTSNIGPHLLTGWVRVGENPECTGWLIAGEFKHWWGLGWFYKLMVTLALETYVNDMIKCQHSD